MALIDEIKKAKEEQYKSFVEKYSSQIDEQLKKIFIELKNSCWYVGVYADKRSGTLLGDIYYDRAVNGGKFNNLLRYVREKGFTATAYYWCGGSCSDADGFKITL